jgi:hypothetical protein
MIIFTLHPFRAGPQEPSVLGLSPITPMMQAQHKIWVAEKGRPHRHAQNLGIIIWISVKIVR